MVTKDPKGNCTDGITRTVSHLTNGGDEDAKQLINWDRTKYLNIWIVKSIGRGAEILGYAVPPTANANSKKGDGVIMLSSMVGSIGTANTKYMGRTLTHEVGHWLGLWHPFQDAEPDISDCGTSDCSRSGDYICDTPPVFSASFGCNTSKNSCNNDSPDQLDQIENFMDYADGKCTNMFTLEQRKRMWLYLDNFTTNGRGTNKSAVNVTGANISNPCAPIADFHVVDKKTITCAGSTIDFINMSWNGEILDQLWTFEGGTPSSSTFNNPKVTYNTPGRYKVTLKVTNALGNSEITKTEFIDVREKVANLASPFIETFESPFSEFTWTREKSGPYGWSRKDNVGYDGGFANVCTIDENTTEGRTFTMYSPNFDLSLHKDLSPMLSFRTAYSMRKSGNAGERLLVYGSDDCGETWRTLKSIVGITTLTSTGSNIPDWKPSSTSDWKLQTVELAKGGFENSTSLLLKFEITSYSGNSVYIDDINVDRNVLSTRDLQDLNKSVSLAPNPSAGSFDIRMFNFYGPIHIEITDILGQKIQTLEVVNNSETITTKNIIITNSGVYFVHVRNAREKFTKQIIVTNK